MNVDLAGFKEKKKADRGHETKVRIHVLKRLLGSPDGFTLNKFRQTYPEERIADWQKSVRTSEY